MSIEPEQGQQPPEDPGVQDGLEDGISEHNVASRIPYEYFRELARLNAARHVPQAQ